MESRSHALLAGTFLVLLLAGGAFALFWFTGGNTQRDEYTVVSTLPVSGLLVEAPVRLLGVDVGAVEEVRFDPTAGRRILVRISVDRGAPLTKGVFAQLALWGISGLTYVSLSDDGSNPEPLPPGGRIEMRPSFIAHAESSVEELIANANQSIQRINALLSDENLSRAGRTLEKLEETVEGMHETTRRLRTDVSGDTLPKVGSLLDVLVSTVRKLDQLLTNLNEQPQSVFFGRSPPRPGPGEPGFDKRKEAR